MASGLRALVGWPVRHVKAVLHWVLVLAALGYIGWQLPDLIRALHAAGPVLASMNLGWIALATVLAVAALVLYGEMHRQLLVIGGTPVPARTVQAITFAENAISNTVPVVGGAGALAYSLTRLRSRGVDTAQASWAVFLPGVLSTVVLIVGGVLIVGAAGWLPMWLAFVVAPAIALGAMGFWSVLTHAAVLRRILLTAVQIGRRVPWLCRPCRGGWAADPDGTASALAARIGVLHPRPGQWVVLVAIAVLSWAGDYLALHAVAEAMGLSVPWTALALGFLAVQLSIALQVLPGGAGLAETGLLGVLLAADTPLAAAAATVLVYRLITWLGLSVVGWVVYAAQIHLTPPHRHRHTEEEEELPPDAVPSH